MRDEGGPSDRPFVVRVRLSCSLTSLTWVDRSKAVSVWRFCSIGTDGPTERRRRTAQEERRRRTYVVGEKEGEGGREGGRTRRGYARSHARAPHTRSVPRQGRRPPHGHTFASRLTDRPTDGGGWTLRAGAGGQEGIEERVLVLLATATVTADSLGHRSEKDAEKRDRGRISGSRRVGERPTRRPTYRLSWGRGREREREKERQCRSER